MQRILIGVAWPYVNGPTHIGHLAGSLLPADIFARYHRLIGDEVLMISGSDMHGTPTALEAEQEGIPPEELASRNHKLNKDAFQRLGLSFDLYTHTHTAQHENTVQEVFLTLLEKRLLIKRTAESPYCPRHQRFLPDRYVTGTCPHCGSETARGDECDRCSNILEAKELGKPVCRLCGTPTEFRPSDHFYFDLPQLAEPLKAYHDSVKAHWRPSVRTFTENYLAGGLKPRPITRDIQWGVPIPLEGYDSKRIYVWFEAVIGYLSAAREWAANSGDPEAWKRFWVAGEEGRVYNFLGKDNITFHTILWPAILIALGGLKLPYDVPANEFVNLTGAKLSKSRTDREGEIPVFLPDLLDRYEPDVIRFYASYHMPENHDTEFDAEGLAHERDQILADQWGNLVHRVLTFVRSNYAGNVPKPREGWSGADSPLAMKILETWQVSGEALEAVHLKEALDAALGLVRETNRAFHDAKPWAAPEEARATATYEALWAIRALTVMLSPYIPFSSQKVASMLGDTTLTRPGAWQKIVEPPVPGTAIGELSPLFPKPVKEKAAPSPAKEEVPLEITIGVVREVRPHPNAERLYVLQVDCGQAAPRTIVAGLKAHYTPEGLVGKRIALLTNIVPRPLRGVTSEGMILAASSGEVVAVVRAPDDAVPGTVIVSPEGPVRPITHDEFKTVFVEVRPDAGGSMAGGVVGRAQGDRFLPLTLPDGRALFPDRLVPAGSRIS